MSATKQSITVLGSTGSIGKSTLDVVQQHPNQFSVFALTANSNADVMAEQCFTFQPQIVVMVDDVAAEKLKHLLQQKNCQTEVLAGPQALEKVAGDTRSKVVMAAIVGAAGLPATLAAVKAGKKVLLANKESLVMAGSLFMEAVADHKATLLPIDSEHNAIFQCLPHGEGSLQAQGVRKLLLTASGGPFLDYPLERLESVTPEQACRHPNWTMGRKISVDSATMMNKGLELIEACHLFSMRPELVEVVIHPQSVIHSMVDYVDGSVLAQLGNPDMRTPIAHALAWPQRMSSGVSALDIIATKQLDFAAPDLDRFPCLALAIKAAKKGGALPIALNAANEVAVDAFLAGKLGFLAIATIIDQVTSQAENWDEPKNLDQVQSLDEQARQLAYQACNTDP